jgi:hypothetical protein
LASANAGSRSTASDQGAEGRAPHAGAGQHEVGREGVGLGADRGDPALELFDRRDPLPADEPRAALDGSPRLGLRGPDRFGQAVARNMESTKDH